MQGDIGNQVEEKDADFVYRHSPIMDGVKLLKCQTKPSPVEPIDPFMGKPEDQKPPKQQRIINQGTPQKDFTY